MRRMSALMIVALVAAGLVMTAFDPLSADDGLNNCNVTGSGTLATGESLAISIHSITGAVRGNVTLAADEGVFVGNVDQVECRRDGGGGPGVPRDFSPNIAEFEGSGSWNGVAGYDYGCVAQDHGEGKSSNQLADEFSCTVADSTATPIALASGLLVSGNFQLRAPQR